MAKEILEGQKVAGSFVKMSAEGMAECMGGKPVLPAELLLGELDVVPDESRTHRCSGILSGTEQILHWSAIDPPVVRQRIQSEGIQHSQAGRAVLGLADMDVHLCAADVLIAKMADLADPKTGTVHQDDHDLCLQVIDRVDDCGDLISGRDERQILIESPAGKLGGIPGLMQDVDREETQMCNDGVDRAIRKTALLLDPGDEIPHILPGCLRRLDLKMIRQIIEIGRDVRCIGLDGSPGSATEGKHVLKSFEIIHF